MAMHLLRRIDAFMDALPRVSARAEDLGPLRLFVKTVDEGWPYFARPIPGAGVVTADDIGRVRARQLELGLPEAFEWVQETSPSFADAARASGLAVNLHPLLVLTADEHRPVGPPPEATVRIGRPEDDHIHLAAVAMAAFEAPGTQVGEGSFDDVERLAATLKPGTNDYKRRRLEAGVTVPAMARIDGRVVAVGFHLLEGSMAEIVRHPAGVPPPGARGRRHVSADHRCARARRRHDRALRR